MVIYDSDNDWIADREINFSDYRNKISGRVRELSEKERSDLYPKKQLRQKVLEKVPPQNVWYYEWLLSEPTPLDEANRDRFSTKEYIEATGRGFNP